MSQDELDIERTMKERRKGVEQTIQPIGVERLEALGEELFPFHDHPWREPYFKFLEENAGCTFYHAALPERVEIIYCRAKERGVWFRPNMGMGPLQASGLAILKDIVDSRTQ
jgi:hypothetical protein